MKEIQSYITEKLILNKNISSSFDIEELRDDYSTVGGAYTKAEKDEFKQKYGVTSNKIRDIQLVILDHLRELRQKRTEFDKDDYVDFIRYQITSDKYEKWESYLKQEPDEFVKFMLKYYQKEKLRKINQALPPSRLSYADRSVLRIVANLKKYLGLS